MGRLIDQPDDRLKALEGLHKLSQSGSREALFVLVRAGDPGALDTATKDLASKDRATRLAAMQALVAAGRFTTAADLLADGDPAVRMQTSCAVLMARTP